MDKRLGKSVKKVGMIDLVKGIKSFKTIGGNHGASKEEVPEVGIVDQERVMGTDDLIDSAINGAIKIIGFVVVKVISKFADLSKSKKKNMLIICLYLNRRQSVGGGGRFDQQRRQDDRRRSQVPDNKRQKSGGDKSNWTSNNWSTYGQGGNFAQGTLTLIILQSNLDSYSF